MKKYSSGRTTKHMSSLEFLLNISMSNEPIIVQRGMQLHSTWVSDEEASGRISEGDGGEDNHSISSTGDLFLPDSAGYDGLAPSLVGKKLQGPMCDAGRLPSDIRYRVVRMIEQNQSTRITRWEEGLLKSTSCPLLKSRVMFSRARGYPVMVSSVVTYNAGEEKARLERQSGADAKSLEVYVIPPRDWRGQSYKSLMKQLYEDKSATLLHERGLVHDPNYLDDPKMVHGSSRQESRGDAKRGPIIYSIIQFRNKKELKERLNEQFRDRHPNIPTSLTFSKIRNLKKSLLLGCVSLKLEVSTAAVAYVCFERLCLKGIVNKMNRHLTMAICLVLAYKSLEKDTGERHANKLEELMSFIDREWEVSKKEVFEAEFGAFVQLGFLIHLPYQHVYTVYSKMLKLLHKTSRAYLGDEMFEMHAADVELLETLNKGSNEKSNGEDDEDYQFEDAERGDMKEDGEEDENSALPENKRPFYRPSTFGSLGALLGSVNVGSQPITDNLDNASSLERTGSPILSTILGLSRRVSFTD